MLKGEQRGQFKIARKMLTEGYPIPLIAEITALSEDEIRRILKSL
ncbi:MAG: hypothetical protein RR790_06900 [Eubacterium sp.]